MTKKRLIRGTSIFMLIPFLLLNVSEGWTFDLQEDIFTRARQLIQVGDFVGALQLLKDYVEKTKHITEKKRDIAEAYYIIAKIYYISSEFDLSDVNLKLVFENYPEFSIEESDLIFQERVNEIKEIVLAPKEKVLDEQIREKEEPVVVEKVGKPKPKKKGGGVIFIIAGLAAAGGAAALLLGGGGGGSNGGGSDGGGGTVPTTGSIQVNSTPTGAQIYLDGSDQGRTTNATLTNLDPGSWTVTLLKEGYIDYTETVNVTAGQTVSMNATLTAHTITVTNPTGSTMWDQGTEVEIRWTWNGSSSSLGNRSLNPQLLLRQRRISSLRMRSFGSRSRSIFIRNRRGKIGDENLTPDRYKALNEIRNNGEISGSALTSTKGNSNLRSSNLYLPRSGIFIDRNKHKISRGIINPKSNLLKQMSITTLSNIKIELYRSSTLIQTIASTTDNDGSYNWIIPTTIAESSLYKIRISCADESSIFGESEYFSISYPGDAYEPDDTYSQASSITTDGTVQSHTINPAGDEDWVVFYASGDTTYTMETSNLVGGCDTVLSIYSTDGTTLLAIDDDGADEPFASRIVGTFLLSGYYYAKVSDVYASSTGSYDIYIRPGDAYEPDDTNTQASSIATDGTVQSHTINPADDEDWMKFNAISGMTYTIETSNLGGDCDTIMSLYSTDGFTLIEYDDDSGTGIASKIVWSCSSSGTYYIWVRDLTSFTTGSYNISVTAGGGMN